MAAPTFELNPEGKVSLRHIGHERRPILILDDLLLDPEALVDAAAAASWAPPDGTYYPGLNADVPQTYVAHVSDGLRRSLGRAFGYAPEVQLSHYAFFALATWSLDKFGPWQRIPHYDQAHADQLAMVHYLHRDQAGGTGFFRQKATGFESVNWDRREGYLKQTTAWLETHGDELTDFAGPETPGYEMFEKVDFRFNRAVIYPSNILHCALFEGATLSDDPRLGRLTANSFFTPSQPRNSPG